MILVQRYIFKELVYNFLFTFVVIALIMLLAMSVKLVFKFPALGLLLLVQNIPIMLAASLTMVIPASVLVSTVMTYGRIAADNEIVTLRASGMHVLRILVPGILFGLMASLFLLVINDRMVPKAERYIKSMESNVDISFLLDTALKSGEKKLELNNDWLLTWEGCKKVVPADGEEAEEIKSPVESWRFTGLRGKLFEEDGVSLSKEIIAESARVEVKDNGRKIIFCLYRGQFVYGQEGSFERLKLPPFEFGSDRRKSKIRLSMRSIAALGAIKQRESDMKVYADHKANTEFHKRIADSFSPIVFVFLALPVAILFRQQNRMVAFLIAILLALFIYYPVSLLGETFSKKGIVDPIYSIWPGNLTLAILGFIFILKVMRR